MKMGREVEPGEPGRLLVRGLNVFAGYLGVVPQPFVNHDGRKWYDIGDMVTCDDGLFRFAGRLKRFVKLGGEMISLLAIEEVLTGYFGDDQTSEPELAVLSKSEERPELILLTIIDISRQVANDALKKAGMSPLHNIRMVRKIEKIPVLGSGKIDYRQLQEMVKNIPEFA
jgi:long-chain-fatty-acid--[acyl-carrier-protein] ligase